jgi:hypothetical protein
MSKGSNVAERTRFTVYRNGLSHCAHFTVHTRLALCQFVAQIHYEVSTNVAHRKLPFRTWPRKWYLR